MPGFRETPRRRYRQFSRLRLALIWVSGVIIVLLVFLLCSAGSPANWLQGVAIALVSPTIGIAVLPWSMRKRADAPRGHHRAVDE
jgi:hypothetical protein